jgi:hypothetical protein
LESGPTVIGERPGSFWREAWQFLERGLAVFGEMSGIYWREVVLLNVLTILFGKW